MSLAKTAGKPSPRPAVARKGPKPSPRTPKRKGGAPGASCETTDCEDRVDCRGCEFYPAQRWGVRA